MVIIHFPPVSALEGGWWRLCFCVFAAGEKESATDCGESGPGGGGGGWALLSPRRAVVSAAEAPLVAVLTGVLYGFSTIGAGDTFVAGMLYGLHADAWSREAFAFAVGLATKKVQREGFAGLVP